jgi:NAD(P)-dependent dehydrogenase (short-subunit alcohol dehydrogenase family)
MSFNGKVAVIAGASGSLGKVVTQQLVQQGTHLVLLGRSRQHLEALLDELKLPAKEHLLLTADLSQPEALGQTVKAAREKFGRIDFLLNLIGGWAGGESLVDVSQESIQEMLQQHLWTTYNLIQAFLPDLKNSPSGRVLVVSSPTATTPGAKTAPYAIGKAAQEALMLTLAKELEGSNATANVIQVKAIDAKHRRAADPSGKYASWATPEEITAAILYLCSEEAKMVNGARIPLYK